MEVIKKGIKSRYNVENNIDTDDSDSDNIFVSKIKKSECIKERTTN